MADAFERYLRRPSRRRLERLVRGYHEHVWRVALRVTGNRDDAEDICQNVFLGLLVRPPRADTVRSPRGYLAYRVVALAQRADRAASRRRKREAYAARRLASDSRGARIDAEGLREALFSLPERIRATLELKYFAGLSVAEIAQTLEVSERTVASDTERGLGALRKRFETQLPGVLVAGRMIRVSAEEDPPDQLLADLLRIVELGVPFTAATALSGAIAMKKLAATGAAVLLVLVIGVGTPLLLKHDQHAVPRATPDEPQATAVVTSAIDTQESNEPSTEKPLSEEAVPDPRSRSRGSITLVVRGADGAPIAGALVESADVDGDDLPPVRADADGVALIENLELQSYALRVRSDGHARKVLPEVRLDESAPGVTREVYLEEECQIVGLVSDHEGGPVTGCSVILSPKAAGAAHFEDTAVSREDGHFGFEHLASGVYVATAKAKGRSVRLFPTPDSLPFMALGKPTIEFAFDRSRTCSLDVVAYVPVHLEGTVRSAASSAAIEGATLSLEYRGPVVRWRVPSFRTTGEDGRYLMQSLMPGRYTVAVTAPGFRTLEEQIDVPEPRGAVDTYELDFRLEPGGVIWGTLVLDGQPVSGSVSGFVKTEDGELECLGLPGTARAGDDGSFAFQRLRLGDDPAPDGLYVLRGLPHGTSDVRTGYERVVRPLPGDVEVEVRDGVGAAGLVVEASRGVCGVRGLVLDPSGIPLPDVALYVISDIGGWIVEERAHATGADGAFSMEQLPCSRGELRVSPPQARYRSRTLEFVLEGRSTPVDLGEIVLEAAGTRSLTVRIAYLDPDADPEPGAIQVFLRRLDENGSQFSRIVGGAATFENLDPGLYQPEVGFSVHLPPNIESVDLREQEHVGVEVAADPGITIQGDLTLAEGFPLQGSDGDFWIPVRLHYAEGGRMGRIARLHEGRYRIQGLHKGSVTKLTLIAARPGERAAYAELPGFTIDRQDQEIPLGHVGVPRPEKTGAR